MISAVSSYELRPYCRPSSICVSVYLALMTVCLSETGSSKPIVLCDRLPLILVLFMPHYRSLIFRHLLNSYCSCSLTSIEGFVLLNWDLYLLGNSSLNYCHLSSDVFIPKPLICLSYRLNWGFVWDWDFDRIFFNACG